VALQAIRGLIDHFEGMKRELCLESTRLSSDEAAESLGPGAEVALAGTSHATDYLSLCRTRIMENDLTLAGRVRAKLEGSSRNAFIAGD